MYVSFAARIRLCGSWHCRKTFLNEFLVDVTLKQSRESLWVPYVESIRCFYPSRLNARTWPYNDILIRKRDWEVFERDHEAYKDAEQAQAERKEGVAQTFAAEERDAQREQVMEQCNAATERFPQIMEVSTHLSRWKWNYDRLYRNTKRLNDAWTKGLAEREGWKLGDLVTTQVYGSLQRRKTFLLEKLDADDVTPIRFDIESELLAMQARQKCQMAEATYRDNLSELKKIYDRMRCGTLGAAETPAGTSGSSVPWILPPLNVFYTLPSVRALKGSPDPSALLPSSTSVTSDIKSSLAMSLITADIHTWLIPVRKHLMTLLGYPNGWQSASMRMLPPLKRVTARFLCRQCGKVGRGYQRQGCLDLKGVCSHVCAATSGKRIEGRPQEIEASDGNAQEKGKKKSSGNTSDWKVDVFAKDEKAISLIKTILNLAGLSEEDPATATALNARGGTIRCMTCKGWIVMDFDTAIGHAHRHESMQIQLLTKSGPDHVGFLKRDAGVLNAETYRPISSTRLAFERGTSELLLGPSRRARNLCKKVNYGCRHCLFVDESLCAVVGIEKAVKGKGPRAMDFNGLRSHVKKKHGIQDIGDEDFFCYNGIQKDGEEG
ncbi:hypothetical protein OG21DRAFT_1486806 [Imleria badia]|nr:hypothetical protein OG21DRAFT_1486806 [Imleria badia]